ncbi:hypothetical protein BH11ARM2_BH11ARM2_09310 [soil metagenome]
MPLKPFDLDQALDEFRTDTPSPEARMRARQAVVRRPRKLGRLVAVGGALAVLLLPVVFRTRGSQAVALTLDGALQASMESPFVLQFSDSYDAKGRTVSHSETTWAPHRRVERMFFRADGLPGLEIRREPGFEFRRLLPPTRHSAAKSGGWKPYETVARTTEPAGGTESVRFFEAERALLAKPDSRRLIRQNERYAWFQLGAHMTWQVERASRRIVRIENRDGGSLFVSRFEFPTRVDASRLDIPTAGTLPRFDLDLERKEMDRLNREGDRTSVFRGQRVKLVGVFQEITAPGQPIYVAYEGKGLARAQGFSHGALTTLKTTAQKVVATVFQTSGPLGKVDVEVPAGGGYVRFVGVRVRPVSERIRSTLRTPPIR